MQVRFIKDTGHYRAGEVITCHPDTAKIWLDDKRVKEVKPKKNKAVKKENVKTKAVASG